MIPSKNQTSRFDAISFWLTDGVKNEVKRYPAVKGTLDVVVEASDSLSRVDLSFCSNKSVWIEVKGNNARRARILYKRLVALDPAPKSICTETPQGLFAWTKDHGGRIFK